MNCFDVFIIVLVFNDFPENQLIKSRALVKANQDQNLRNL